MNREECRMKLWCDVYVAITALPETNRTTALAIANDSLEDFDKTFPENVKAEKESGELSIPEGWRLMAVGEVIRKGDKFFKECEWRLWNQSIGLEIEANDIQFRSITPIGKCANENPNQIP